MKKNYRLGICLWASYGLLACTQEARVYTTSETEVWKQAVVEVHSVGEAVPDIVVSDEQEQSFRRIRRVFRRDWMGCLCVVAGWKTGGGHAGFVCSGRDTFCIRAYSYGANDFARDYYTCNDTAGDFEMRHFTIERDKQAMIPYVKAALKQNPELKLWTSPWTPPVWMKATRHYATAPGDHNDFTEENEVEGDHLIQQPEYLKAYALYQSKFVEAYRKEGVNISLLQFQNEPYTKNQWPNCSWTPASMANFIGRYLGPLFAQEHPEVELYFGTFNCNRMADLDRVMQDTAAARYVRGIGLQWEARTLWARYMNKYPEMQLMQTENECGSGTFDWAAAEHTFDLIKTYLDGGVNTYMYFKYVLQE